jgi:hypothetical protein
MSNQVTLTSTGALSFSQGNQAPTLRYGQPGDQLTLDAAGQPSWAQGDTTALKEVEDDLAENVTATALVQTHLDTTNTAQTKLKAAQFSGDTAAIADGSLVAGDFSFWLTTTNGSAVLNVKAKEAGGTVRTATIALA